MKWIANFFRATKCELLITFWKLQVKASFVFRQFSFILGLRTKSAKKACLRFAIFNCNKKLQNIFEIEFKKCEVIEQNWFSEKIFQNKQFTDILLFIIC